MFVPGHIFKEPERMRSHATSKKPWSGVHKRTGKTTGSAFGFSELENILPDAT